MGTPFSLRRRASRIRRAPALEWPWNEGGGQLRAALQGRRALIENHTGILEIAEDQVRLASRQGELRVCGEGLSLREVRVSSLIVEGRIESVQFPSREGQEHA